MQHEANEWKVKIAGRRMGFITSTEAANEWLHSINKLRGNHGICPRGVYRFATFEEADRWMLQMLVQSTLAARRSTI
jgi:hypothetical protein